jgi:hypothetical protein
MVRLGLSGTVCQYNNNQPDDTLGNWLNCYTHLNNYTNFTVMLSVIMLSIDSLC